MAVHVTNIFIVLSILVATHLLKTRANPPYTFTEGKYNAADPLFSNCTFDLKGWANKVREGDIPIISVTKGAVITYINVLNYMPVDQQGTIRKTSGGVGHSSANFHVISAFNHGFRFQFEMRGRVPPGEVEPVTTGNCLD